jgi:hypothetical protein
MLERDKFMARLERDRQNGLTDMKFFFMPDRPLSPEEIFAAMNQVEEAIEAGQCFTHSGWNGNAPRA